MTILPGLVLPLRILGAACLATALLGGCAIYPGCPSCPKHTDPAMAPADR